MRIKDLIEQLSMYEENSEVIIYDDDNDREYEIAAIDADEGDESDNADYDYILKGKNERSDYNLYKRKQNYQKRVRSYF